MKKEPNFEDIVTHFPQQISQELIGYVREVVFLTSRYIFTHREGKRQFGYCTHCHRELETLGLRHGTTTVCQSCNSLCGVKASGKGRKMLVDEAYFVWYEKSLVNPEAITARGMYVVRDYRGDYHNVETLIEVKAMYLFEPGNSVMFERPWLYYSYTDGMSSGNRCLPRKSISSLFNTVMSHKPCFCSYESIREAVKDTPLRYSTWEQYKSGDLVKFFDLAAKYPCVEYLTKLGMRGIVDAKLDGYRTYNVVNWRGQQPLKVLKMTKKELSEIRAAKVTVDPWMLNVHRLAKKDDSKLSFTDIARISSEIPEVYQNYLKAALAWTNLRKLDAYFTRQLANPGAYRHYSSKQYLLSTWNDYLRDCVQLELDTSDEAVKFPRNLYQAHQNTIKQIKLKADEALTARIGQRCKLLRKMQFEALGFILRPAASSQELIDEGKALHHCVGTYAERYANGQTDIFFLRRTRELDKPFYTMEVRNGNIVQCRGLKNCVPTEDVKHFIELFVSRKLLTKKRTRVGIAV